jgi:hypothetical protein
MCQDGAINTMDGTPLSSTTATPTRTPSRHLLAQAAPRERCDPARCRMAAAGRKCYMGWHSVEASRSEAWRWSRTTAHGLEQAAREGRHTYAVTLTLPARLDPGAVAASGKALKAAIAAANRHDRADLQVRARLHLAGRRGGRAHWHLAAHSARPLAEVRSSLKAVWSELGGDPASVHVRPIREAEAYAAYSSRHGDPDAPVPARGVISSFGTGRFFPTGGEPLAWIECDPVAERRARRRASLSARRARTRTAVEVVEVVEADPRAIVNAWFPVAAVEPAPAVDVEAEGPGLAAVEAVVDGQHVGPVEVVVDGVPEPTARPAYPLRSSPPNHGRERPQGRPGAIEEPRARIVRRGPRRPPGGRLAAARSIAALQRSRAVGDRGPPWRLCSPWRSPAQQRVRAAARCCCFVLF